ncbi:MAG: nitrogenase component 1 [Lachnospiraceae bacterium]
MNEIKHLRCLAAVKAMNGVVSLSPAAYPGNHCPMHTALSLASRVKGMSTLVIGTAECGYYSRNIPAASPYRDQALHWTYILDSNEVVFGFRKGLMAAIKEMDREGAKIILLIGTCVPEVVCEDIEGLEDEMANQIKARLLYVPLGNFKCGSYQPGYWKTLRALGGLMKKRQTNKMVINVLGRSAAEEHIPAPQLIEALIREEFTIRYLAPDSSIEDFTDAGDASLNLVLSPFMNPLAERIKAEHEITYFSLHDVYETEAVRRLYENIYRELGKPVSRQLDDGFLAVHELQQKCRRQMTGKSFISAQVGAVQPLPLAAYFRQLGMLPVMIHMEEFYPSDTLWRQQLLEQDANPIICMMVNEQADRRTIQELEPDLVIGDWAGRADVRPVTVPVLELYGQIGYERTGQILERILGGQDGII